MHYWLVMPAAGTGQRFGGGTPKQHAPLGGATVLEISLRRFIMDARCRGIVVALAASDVRRYALRTSLPSTVHIVDGGAQRSDSVLRALDDLAGRAADNDWVLVHDAARPCLSAADLERLLLAGSDSPGGALLAAPVADTIKRATDDGHSAETMPREQLWRAQTPQMFRYRQLREALQQARAAGREPTDDAQALEWLGVKPQLVAAQDSNIKITTAEDLAVAAAILAARR